MKYFTYPILLHRRVTTRREYVGIKAAIIPKIPLLASAVRSVRRRPMRSPIIPQVKAPIIIPIKEIVPRIKKTCI